MRLPALAAGMTVVVATAAPASFSTPAAVGGSTVTVKEAMVLPDAVAARGTASGVSP